MDLTDPSPTQLTQRELQTVRRHLQQAGARSTCERCEGTLALRRQIVALPAWNRQAERVAPRDVILNAVVHCRRCGQTTLHDLRTLGVDLDAAS